jgi:hypothetical protein
LQKIDDELSVPLFSSHLDIGPAKAISPASKSPEPDEVQICEVNGQYMIGNMEKTGENGSAAALV